MSPAPLRVLAVEPWLGGSHASFLESWQHHSVHAIEVVGLPDRHWRWRLRDGARALAAQIADRPSADVPDVIWASDYLDLPTFYGFLPGGWSQVPCVYMFHENQLTYPPDPERAEVSDERDLHHAYTHVLSVLRAARVVFNSEFHRGEFTAAAAEFLSRLPSPAPRAALVARLAASSVVHPGIELERIPLGRGPAAERPLAIAFPHRFEHDKDPRTFLEVMLRLADRGLDFELHLFGERYAHSPRAVDALQETLRSRIAHDGFVESFPDYARALGATDVVVSTARHEFYGLGVLEAVAAGARPCLPARLSYPELFTKDALWSDLRELEATLLGAAEELPDLRNPDARRAVRMGVAAQDAGRMALQLDELCADCSKFSGFAPDLV